MAPKVITSEIKPPVILEMPLVNRQTAYPEVTSLMPPESRPGARRALADCLPVCLLIQVEKDGKNRKIQIRNA